MSTPYSYTHVPRDCAYISNSLCLSAHARRILLHSVRINPLGHKQMATYGNLFPIYNRAFKHLILFKRPQRVKTFTKPIPPVVSVRILHSSVLKYKTAPEHSLKVSRMCMCFFYKIIRGSIAVISLD